MIEEEFIEEMDKVLKNKFGGDNFKIAEYCEENKDNPVVKQYLEIICKKVDKELGID